MNIRDLILEPNIPYELHVTSAWREYSFIKIWHNTSSDEYEIHGNFGENFYLISLRGRGKDKYPKFKTFSEAVNALQNHINYCENE